MKMERGKEFSEWCIVELLGHRRLAGFVTEQEIAGAGFLRLDIPGGETGLIATQLINPASVYCLTPTTEEIARGVADANRPQPVRRWELPAATGGEAGGEAGDEFDSDYESFTKSPVSPGEEVPF